MKRTVIGHELARQDVSRFLPGWSWLLSLSLHGIAIGLAIHLTEHLRVVEEPLFVWNILLVSSPEEPRQAGPISSDSALSSSTQARMAQDEPQPAETRPLREPAQSRQPTRKVVQEERRTFRGEPASRPSIPSKAQIPESVSGIRQQAPAVVETVAHPPTASEMPNEPPRMAQSPLNHLPPPVAEPPPMENSRAQKAPMAAKTPAADIPPNGTDHTPLVQDAIEDQAVQGHTPGPQHVGHDTERQTGPAGPVQEPVGTFPTHHEPAMNKEPNEIATGLTMVARTFGEHSRAFKPDFGWLAEALLRRVQQQLKRYPPLARMRQWEGRVVLRAVIQEDGQLLDLDVAESSGYSILDLDAMEIIKRACPLELKHSLGRPHIAVLVPIHYKLEH